MKPHALKTLLDSWLTPQAFKDYGPNGLQVEGDRDIRTVVTGVTASLALIEAAIDLQADAVVVHHGLFWRGADPCVTGWLRARLAALLRHGVSLLAYHLPLDAHPELGNNAQLALRLGLEPFAERRGRFGEQDLGWIGQPKAGTAMADAGAWARHVEARLGRPVTWVPGDGRPLQTIAWCSGGAQSYFEAAIAAGADAYLTGELSEPQTHYARESGVAYLACGHHATERYGVQALGQRLEQEYGLRHHFVDIDNPA